MCSPASPLSSFAPRRGDAVVTATVGAREMTPLHVHDADETVTVLDGAIVVHVGGEVVSLGRGETVTAPAGVPHTLVGGPVGAHYVASTSTRSTARYADFLRAVAAPGTGSAAPDEEDDVVASLARESGIDVLGPPGALP